MKAPVAPWDVISLAYSVDNTAKTRPGTASALIPILGTVHEMRRVRTTGESVLSQYGESEKRSSAKEELRQVRRVQVALQPSGIRAVEDRGRSNHPGTRLHHNQTAPQPGCTTTRPHRNQAAPQPGCTTTRLHRNQAAPQPGHTTTRLHHNQAAPKPGCTTTRLHHNQATPQPGHTATRLHHNQAAPQPGCTTTRLHRNQAAPQPGCTETRLHRNRPAPQPVCTTTEPPKPPKSPKPTEPPGGVKVPSRRTSVRNFATPRSLDLRPQSKKVSYQ
ncbi:Small proline-rich protein 3 [Folsomia candida]|uniref:Small proline-rich protein 3 n=1 Tax=Folsomia candida TaxID=158441 RepID=A0A226DFT0_FOLCA|nr:Small proline-rich protein 3 [Folsomia candida]